MNASELHCVLVPADRPESGRAMVVLHGLGDSIEGYRFMPYALRVPDLNYVLVNAPDHYFGGYSWYSYPHSAASGPDIDRSRGLLFQLLDALREKGFKSEDTFLFGFSQGCLMVLETGMRYPHRLAGVIGVSGYAHDVDELNREQAPAARQQRFLLTHGTLDDVVPVGPTEKQVERLRGAGMDIRWQTYAKPHTIIDPEFALFREFIGETG